MSRLIKKYKNRRLYDTEISQFITIDELKKYVIDGEDFWVEEIKTGLDVTNIILLQIVTEMESGATQLLSREILKELIKLGSHPFNQSYKQLLDELFNTMTKYRQSNPIMDQAVEQVQQATKAWEMQMQTLFKDWQGLFKK